MNQIVTPASSLCQSRSQRLKAATTNTHDRLDKSIMNAEPFADRQRYGRFVQVQYLFHRDIDVLYDNPQLDALLPDLRGRRRLPLIAQDLADLGIELPTTDKEPVFVDGDIEQAQALGWLYVAEGSNLGAAFLLKEALKLGLSATFGARHLAGAPEGRGLHWRTFTQALDSVPLDEHQEAEVIAGVQAAFARVHSLVQERLK